MKILLVEDEADLATILQQNLSREHYLVDWAEDGELGWDYLVLDWRQYSVAIIDWMLPKLSGLELCRKLRQHGISIPILMLTAKDGVDDLVMGLDAGADDYLTKPFTKIELLARLRALQRRSPQLTPTQLTIGNLVLDYAQTALRTTDRQSISLTPSEFRLLDYFMRHPNQTLTHDQLLSQCWEDGGEANNNVLAAQIRLLRRKLATHGYDDLIETVRGFGYRLKEDL